MKITQETTSALQQTESQERNRTTSGVEGFDDILAREVQETETQDTARTAVPPIDGGMLEIASLIEAEGVSPAADLTEKELTAMENVDSLLTEWENYADQLASGEEGGGLRQAYGVLEHIESGVQKLKQDWPGMDQENPDMGSLVNELEVMAVTEKIKFNRGDYI
ncbi:hypothetical protein [Desulfolutivibrio sulfoxidireducens]|uniref:hypothetical protein n=1 Tax=Desulfolutivibrio sulfoxidireducens TaxID=2773299 RepID=UPI00159D20D3|nr:hypothetical protein [Desulfolutivibrio sulfoxidireducens]QLA15040.1 hypothetical protein GD605_02200 [Desulfolutivibrio sulfoxidireducens]QLA18609.1 hypothetical protein GD604_02115 [Desulfolutivibrio sulfoxidireducens]